MSLQDEYSDDEKAHPIKEFRSLCEHMAVTLDAMPVGKILLRELRMELSLTAKGPKRDALLVQEDYLLKVIGQLAKFGTYLECLYVPIDDAGNTAGPMEIAGYIRGTDKISKKWKRKNKRDRKKRAKLDSRITRRMEEWRGDGGVADAGAA